MNIHPVLPPVYLCDWYHTKVEYHLMNNESYFNKTEESYVYVMYNKISKLYKIGRTKQILLRLNQIRTQSGCEIEIVLCLKLHTKYDESATIIESLLHEFFKKQRTFGEWFILDLKCLIGIKNLFWKIEGEDIEDNLKSHFNTIKL